VAAAELTEQTAGVMDAKPTGSAEVAAADSPSGADELMICVGICGKLTVCGNKVTEKLSETLEAGAYSVFPA
jgi:hypothetical protein